MTISGGIVCSGVIDGENGVSIVSANVWYALTTIGKSTNGQEPADSAFTLDEFPVTLNAGYYIWQCTKIIDSTGHTTVTGKIYLGPTTDFLSGTEVYAVSQSNSIPPADSYFSTSYEKIKGYYLWSATRVQYTSGAYACLNKKCVGYWGEDGRGVSGISVSYAISNVGTESESGKGPSHTYGSWSDNAPEPTATYRYLWRREITTYTVGGSVTRYYLQAVRGQAGESSLTADLSNEIEPIALDKDGKVLKPSTVTDSYMTISTAIRMFYGTEESPLTSNPHTEGALPAGITYNGYNASSKTISFRVTYGTKPFGDTAISATINISVTCEHGTLVVPYTLIGMRSGVTYQLLPSASAIIKKKGETQYTPSELSCISHKYQNGDVIDNPAEIALSVIPDNNTSSQEEYNAGSTLNVASFGATKSITFEAKVGNLVVDRETIPIIEDGQDGAPATEKNETRFAWSTSASTANSTTAPVLDTGVDWQENIPNRPASGIYYLWQQVKRYTWNTTRKVYERQSTKYFRMSGEDAKATQIKGSVVAVMEHSQDWSQATTDAPVGSFVIQLNHNKLFKKLGANNWSDNDMSAASEGDAYLLSSNGHLWIYTGPYGANVQWTDVGQLQGPAGSSAYVHIAWANAIGATMADFTDFTVSKDPGEIFRYVGFYTDEQENDSTNPLDYTWNEIKGKDAVTYRIAPSLCSVKVTADGILRGHIEGTLYRDEAGTTTPVENATIKIFAGSLMYEYDYVTDANGFFSTQSTVHSWIDGALWRSYSNFVDLVVRYDVGGRPMAILHIPILQDGQQGERGLTGRSYYYKDTWEDFSARTGATFDVTEAESPFFSLYDSTEGKDKYWVFVGENGVYTASSAGTPGSGNANWLLMVTDFKFLISEAIFTNFAKLGSAVFNKDWMISQYVEQSGQRATYNTFSPQFPNADEQNLTLIKSVVTSTATAVSAYDKVCQMVMRAGVRYTFSINATGRSDSLLSLALLKPDGTRAETLEGGDLSLTFSGSTILTGAVTPSQSGMYYWVGRVGSASYAGGVSSIRMTCTAPFVPKVAVDWLTGYAHFGGDKVRFNPDGSGYLAGGNLAWTAGGDTTVRGTIMANALYAKTEKILGGTVDIPQDIPLANVYYIEYVSDITLPSASDYDGLELVFYAPMKTRTAVYSTLRSDSIFNFANNDELHARVNVAKIIHANNLVRLIAIGGEWVCLQGSLSDDT